MSKKNYLCVQKSVHYGTMGNQFPPVPDHGWREKFKANIADAGGQLGAGIAVGSNESPLLDTIPAPRGVQFNNQREVVCGYLILSAESLKEAVNVLRSSPELLAPGAQFEIREILAPSVVDVITSAVRYATS